MTMEQTVQFLTVVIAAISIVAIRRMTARVTIKVDALIVLVVGMFSVSWLAFKGPLVVAGFEISATNIATFNRAWIAAVLSVIAVRMYARRRESRRARGARET